jgi:hypothetical protein
MAEIGDNLMNLKDMGFTATGNISEGQGIVGIGQVAKTIEKGQLDRLKTSEYSGTGGFIDNILRASKALVGQDTVSREVVETRKWVKKVGSRELKQQIETFLQLDAQTQIERMSGGDPEARSMVEELFKTHKKGETGNLATLSEQLGSVWQNANEWMNGKDVSGPDGKQVHIDGQYDADKKLIDEYMDGAEDAKTETFNALGEMWRWQEKKDLVNRTASYINSSDHNIAVSSSGEHGSRRQKLEGGAIRRALAWVKGLPREWGERGNALVRVEGITEARSLAIKGGLSELKHDALSRAKAGSLDRVEMFARGLITQDELGIKDNAAIIKIMDEIVKKDAESVAQGNKKDVRLLNRIGKFRNEGKVAKASNASAIAYYDRLYTSGEKAAHEVYDVAKAKWGKYALKAEGGFAAGILPAPLTELTMKLSALGLDGVLMVRKGVDGTFGLALESVDTAIADMALARIGEATVARELAAKNYLTDPENKSNNAKILRGADTIWQHAIVLGGDAVGTIEGSQTSPITLHLPGAIAVEGAEMVLGGKVSKRSGKLMVSLAERNNKLLSGKHLISAERLNIQNDDYAESLRGVTEEVGALFQDIPEHFQTRADMEKWMNERVLGFQVTDRDLIDVARGVLSGTKLTKRLADSILPEYIEREPSDYSWISDPMERAEREADDLADIARNKEKVLLQFNGLDYRNKVLSAIGRWTDPEKYKSQLGKILNQGSERRTVQEVLGLEDHEGKRINRTANQIPLIDQMVIVRQKLSEGSQKLSTLDVTTAEHYNAALEHASLSELDTAQRDYLQVQKNRMQRRKKLDKMWEAVPKTVGETAGAIGAMFAFKFIGNHFHEVAQRFGIELGETQGQLQYAQEALKAAGNPDVFVDPAYAATHQGWSLEAGKTAVDNIKDQVGEVSKDLLASKAKAIASYATVYLAGAASLATSVFTSIKLVGGAITPFVGGKIARMTAFDEDRPEIK